MVIQRPKSKLTYADYRATPDDERYELIDGELILAPAPRTAHQSIQAYIGSELFMFVRETRAGYVFFAPTDVALSDTDVVQPDILFVSNERARIITENDIQGAPDFVIEILSPSTAQRDRGVKHALYERHGVKEYWMIDPASETVLVLLLGANGFEFDGEYGAGDTIRSATLDDFAIELGEVFGMA